LVPAGSGLLNGSVTGKALGCPTKGGIACFAASTFACADPEEPAADEPDEELEPQAATDATATTDTHTAATLWAVRRFGLSPVRRVSG